MLLKVEDVLKSNRTRRMLCPEYDPNALEVHLGHCVKSLQTAANFILICHMSRHIFKSLRTFLEYRCHTFSPNFNYSRIFRQAVEECSLMSFWTCRIRAS